MPTVTLADMITFDEGSRNYPYKCTAGKLTIGVGRNLEDVGISQDEIQYLLNNDLARVRLELINDPDIGKIYSSLDEVRQMAIKNMCFNLGLSGLKKFKKMWKALEHKNYDEAAKQAIDSRWYRQVKSRGPRVVHVIKHGNLDSYAEVL